MALSYPLSLAAFQDVFTINMAEFYLNNPRQVDRTASGSQLSASLGDAVWRGSFQIPPTNSRSESGRVDALLSALDKAGSSVLLYDPSKPSPASGGTPTGSIAALDGSDRRLISISGLPSGYQLKAGDLLGFTYSGKYALHRLVEDATGSTTGLVHVEPFLQPDVTTGITVTFVKPVIKAVIRPGPDYGSHRAVVSSAKSFEFVQEPN